MLDKSKQENLKNLAESTSSHLRRYKVDENIQQYRYTICQNCEKFFEPTNTCKVCGCFMNLKTWIPKASCPLQKWASVSTNQ